MQRNLFLYGPKTSMHQADIAALGLFIISSAAGAAGAPASTEVSRLIDIRHFHQ